MNSASAWTGGGLQRRRATGADQGVGLWAFIGVASMLFALFIVAYVMRMSEPDATSLALPWQFRLSTAWLLLGSVLMHNAVARGPGPAGATAARACFGLGGACALAFIAVQGWAWQEMLAAQVTLYGNPAGSFFFLLTAMHGLHVAGGLLAWALALVALQVAQDELDDQRWRLRLCARYWHFLLGVWLLLYAALAWITPEVAGIICGRR
jgi:cytochrome c oxidase subunit III